MASRNIVITEKTIHVVLNQLCSSLDFSFLKNSVPDPDFEIRRGPGFQTFF